MATSAANPAPGTSTMQGLSDWAAPYVTQYLGQAQALAQTPYQVYQGPLTAGESALQTQAFQGIGNLTVPTAIGDAASSAQSAAQRMGNLSYTPTEISSGFNAPAAYSASNVQASYQAPAGYQTGTFGSQFTTPETYQSKDFTTGIFGTPEAQQYMNPYLTQALDPQLAEARRQAQITRIGDASRLTQAGAFGGSRQAIMESELNRNLGTKLADITGAGYNTAYQEARAQFNADQARKLQADQASEASRQFGYGQGMTAADLQARYGLSAQQAAEQSRQFGYGQQMTAAQQAAANQLEASRINEASRQFGYGQQMTGADLAARYGLDAQRATEASRQFGANYGLSALQGALSGYQTAGNLGLSGLQAQQGILNTQLGAGQAQRAIESEGVAADLAEFNAQRDYPYRQLQFQQGMLSGLPTTAVSSSAASPSTLANMLSLLGGLGYAQSSGGISALQNLFGGLLPNNTESE